MKRFGFVLLGGRPERARRGVLADLAFIWLPVVLMILIIARESTAAFGSVNTSSILRPIYETIFGRVPNEAWEPIHHRLRKTGHFVGYGTLGVTWLRAYLITWWLPFRHRAASAWRRWSLQMAICCTALIASLDEVHQSYIPDRTGLVTDVLLDTTGAIIFCSLLALFWLRRSVRDACVTPA